jgi:NAD(P)H-nitrite reductase large subunit
MARTDKTTYLISGNSVGGIGAAEAIREIDKAGAITIISDESYPIYSRLLISEYLAHRYPLERMLFHAPDFCEQSNI